MHRSMRNFMLFSKESGVSIPQIGALMQIQHGGLRCITEISADLGITSAAASQMLERLVQQKFIVRSEDPMDRRMKQIVLTEKGLQMLKESIRARQSWLDELASILSPAEQVQISAALNIMIEKTARLDQESEPEHRP